MDYNNKLLKILESTGLSQQSLAEKIGTSFVSLNSWLNNKTSLTRKDLMVKIDLLYEQEILRGNPTNTVMIGDNLIGLRDMINDNRKVDIVYIDPPYNTGNSFSYNDKRSTEQWNQFMHERISLTHPLLKSDGVMFISIDDSSLYELKLMCDKVFGKNNFLGTFITKQATRSNSNHINTIHEYIVAYAKDKKKMSPLRVRRRDNPMDAKMIKDISVKVSKEHKANGIKSAEKLLAVLNKEYMKKKDITWLRNYSNVDENGQIFFAKDLSVPGRPADLEIPEIGLSLKALKTRKWSSTQKFIKLHKEGNMHFKGTRPYEKHLLNDSYDNVVSILDFYSRQGTNDLNKLGLRDLFDTPKPVELIKYLIRISSHEKQNAIILDYFAGSGTVGQAVMEINKEDDKNHIYYLMQLDEKIAKGTAQYEFAISNSLKPSVDQLMLKRLNEVGKKINQNVEYNLIKLV